MFVLWLFITAIVGVIVGALFSGKISKAVKSLETTVELKLSAIETAIKAQAVHSEVSVASPLKNSDVVNATEQTAKI